MAKVRPLTPKLAEVARKELFEDPARLETDIQHLKDWLAEQPHLKARTDDQFLAAFLRGAKSSLEKAKEKLDAYYTLRTALPEFFSKRDPTSPEIRKVLQLGLFLPLGVDAEGRRVMLMRNAAYDPKEFNISDIFKCNMMIMDMLLVEDDALIVKGQVAVLDLKNMTMAHATHMQPALAKKATTVFQEGYPLRPKAFHYVHLNSVFNAVFKIFTSLITEKLQNRITLHPDMESLYKRVPKEILPQEYGGNAGTIKEISDALAKNVEAWRDYFLEDEKYGTDESKRPGKPKTHEDLFGLESSYPQINVD